MDYSHCSSEELAADDFFIRWVKAPDEETERFWRNWVEGHPAHAETVQEARQLVGLLAFGEDAADRPAEDRIRRGVYGRLGREVPGARTLAQPAPQMATWFSGWRRMAAVWTGLVVAGLLGWWTMRRGNQVQYRTGYGQLQTVRLPDGSSVTLNANSRLRFPGDWPEQGSREVWLDGEAFFTVTHRAGHQRFVVHTDDLQVEVLGTSFNVRQREDRARVVLVTGKIRLRSGNAPDLEMKPGELVEVTGPARQPVRRHVNPQPYTAWKERQLVFDHAPLREVAQLIEDQYGYQLHADDSTLLNQRLTLKLPGNELPVLLESIEKLFDVKVTRGEKRITLTRNAAP
jgi:ferric-dicitrate binding protein FerR (iron transport regulator)